MKKSLLTLSILALAASAQAAIITQDSFLTGVANYTVGDLNGQNPTRTGASGAWTANTTYDISATGLTFSGLATAGGSVAVTVAPTGGGTNWVTATETATAPGTSPFYLSFLMRIDNKNDVRLGLGANNGSTPTRFIGSSTTQFYAGGSVAGTILNNTTYLMIGKITPQFSGNNDLVDLWAIADGSSIPVSEAAAGAATVSGSSLNIVTGTGTWQANFGWYYSNVNASNSFNASYDELRIGTTWADVTPVPEPTTWALLAGSLTALMVFRRRRQA